MNQDGWPWVRAVAGVLLTAWAVWTLSFLAVHLLPGDPARVILGPQASADAVSRFQQQAGLNRPLVTQYIDYSIRLATLDFGPSYSYRQPVRRLLWDRGRVSAILAGCAILVATLLGLAVPLVCRIWKLNHVLEGVEFFATIAAFAPPHVLAVSALLLFGGVLGWIPTLYQSDSALRWVVAAGVLAFYPAVLVLRLFDARLGQELAAPYCVRARAAGLPNRVVVLQEACRNALPAALAALANGLAFFVSGSLFVEAVFGVPGLGSLTHDALRTKDVNLLVGVCVVLSVIVTALSSALSFALESVDPRRRANG